VARDNAVFFPLRSSAGWFRSPDTVKQFEGQLKTAAFCFDRVVLENGNYHVAITENGTFEYPPTFEPEHRQLRFNKGGEVSLRIELPRDREDLDSSLDTGPDGYTPLISGTALAAYYVDFYPILHPAGVLRESCFKWVNKPLAEEEIEKVRQAAQEETQAREFWEGLPFPHFEKGYVAQSYYHDTVRMAMLGLPTLFDERVSEFTRRKGQQLVEFAPDVAPRIYHMALVNRMPDISVLPWDKVIETRDTPVAQEFRNMIARVRRTVLEELSNLESQADVHLLTSELYSKELTDEALQFVPKKRDVGFNAILNLVPALGGWLGTALGVAQYIKVARAG
jgi:hypothetical protein